MWPYFTVPLEGHIRQGWLYKLLTNLFTYLQDLNNETLNHLDAENRRQTLEEEMEFLKKVHEQVSTF